MKKHAYILICITLLCVVCVAAAHVTLLGTADEAEFDLTVYAGDPSAAEGITLTMRQSSLHQLFWDTTLRLTDPENPETQFTAESVPERAESVKYPPSGLRMILPSVSHRYDLGSISFDAKEWRKQLEDSGSGLSTEMMIQIDALGDRMGEPFTNWETEENRFLLQAVLDAAEQTEAGATKVVSLPLNRYLNDLPYYVNLELKDYAPGYDMESQFALPQANRMPIGEIFKRDQAFERTIRDYFRFPVPDDAKIVINLTKKDATHVVTKMEIRFVFPTSRMGTVSTVTEGKCWFIPSLGGEEQLDFSTCRGEAGLYCLPFSTNQDDAGNLHTTVETDAMNLVLPLQENEKPLNIYAVSLLGEKNMMGSGLPEESNQADQAKDTLLILLQIGESRELVLFDPETETVRQRLTLFQEEEWGDRLHFIFQPLGGKLFAASGTRVHYYESDENGCYQLLLDAPDIAATMFQPQIISQYISGPFAIAWDGRRLAIANVDGGRYATSNGDLLLGVFDSTGLHYLAGLKSGPMQPTTIGKGEKAVYWGEYLTPKEGVLKLAFDDTEGGADP